MNSSFYYKQYFIKVNDKSGKFEINITLRRKDKDMLIALENCFNMDIFKKYRNLFMTIYVIRDLEYDIKEEIDRIENRVEKNKIFF